MHDAVGIEYIAQEPLVGDVDEKGVKRLVLLRICGLIGDPLAARELVEKAAQLLPLRERDLSDDNQNPARIASLRLLLREGSLPQNNCYPWRIINQGSIMNPLITAPARRELVEALRQRYAAATREEKVRILTEFAAVSGLHRKSAIRVLNAEAEIARSPRLYVQAVEQALITLWEASDRVCGKRRKALLPILVAALEKHGHLALDAGLRKQLLALSAATIDRLLVPTKRVAGGPRKRPTPGHPRYRNRRCRCARSPIGARLGSVRSKWIVSPIAVRPTGAVTSTLWSSPPW